MSHEAEHSGNRRNAGEKNRNRHIGINLFCKFFRAFLALRFHVVKLITADYVDSVTVCDRNQNDRKNYRDGSHFPAQKRDQTHRNDYRHDNDRKRQDYAAELLETYEKNAEHNEESERHENHHIFGNVFGNVFFYYRKTSQSDFSRPFDLRNCFTDIFSNFKTFSVIFHSDKNCCSGKIVVYQSAHYHVVSFEHIAKLFSLRQLFRSSLFRFFICKRIVVDHRDRVHFFNVAYFFKRRSDRVYLL